MRKTVCAKPRQTVTTWPERHYETPLLDPEFDSLDESIETQVPMLGRHLDSPADEAATDTPRAGSTTLSRRLRIASTR